MEKIDLNTSLKHYIYTIPRIPGGFVFCCKSEGIDTVRDLCRLHPNEIANWKNIGRTTIQKIDDGLKLLGLKLGMSQQELDIYEGIRQVPTEQKIDWESRTWEATMLYTKMGSSAPIDKAVELVESYKKKIGL